MGFGTEERGVDWKESLAALSGGQRALIALSLLLALLKFKPAPIYILDEIDAALDLSHTQNIGNMIRNCFKQSQFIIVSHKPGMFNSANVVFKVVLVDGKSTVQRTTVAGGSVSRAAEPSQKQAVKGKPAVERRALAAAN